MENVEIKKKSKANKGKFRNSEKHRLEEIENEKKIKEKTKKLNPY